MLARFQKSMKDKDQGFTLIELLVVIVIIGILAAIAIPLFLNQRKKGVDSSMKSDVKSAATTVETHLVDNAPVAATTSVAAAAAGTGPLDGFKSSTGNAVRLKMTATGAYCIDVINSGSSDALKYVVYNSSTGGLQSGFSTGCP